MLESAKIVTFISTRSSDRAREFYVSTLGLNFVSDDQFALVLDSNGITLRVSKVKDFTPQQFTVLGWEVGDIEESVRALADKGVRFEKYGFPGQDERGIWTVPSSADSTGARVAWFKDPDGNVLSVSQLA